jgi:hypothetical protein
MRAYKNQVMEESLQFKKGDLAASESEADESREDLERLELGNVVVTGYLSAEFVQAVLEKHMHSLNLCVRRSPGKHQALKEKVVFKLFIDPAGKVVKVDLDGESKEKKAFEQCMVKELRKLRFPASSTNKKAVITVTFVLK